MKVIGLTGGIGSGKSLVGRIFQSVGVPVFDADKQAIALYESDPDLLRDVVRCFGTQVLNSEGKLNRQTLAAIVFSDEQALKSLNALVHPLVFKRFSAWKHEQKGNVVIREAAILFESGSNADCDFVVLVSAPEQMRIERVMHRNGLDEGEVKARISRQWPEEKLRSLADFEIVNDEKKLLLPQVMNLIHEIGIE